MKTTKLIIENRSTLSMLNALVLAQQVVKNGRISNNNRQYTLGTIFDVDGVKIAVYSELNKKSDKLIVTNHYENN